MSSFVWVKHEYGRAFKVDTTECRNVNELKESVKQKLGDDDSVDIDLLTLSISSTAEDGSVALTTLAPGAPVPVQQYANGGSPIPLIVQVLEPQETQRRPQWKTTKLTAPVPSYTPESSLFELDSKYLPPDYGLASSSPPPQNLILYCRSDFHLQFEFLQDKVLTNSKRGWIIGPLGTGKSITALAFASTLDRNKWVITWIQLNSTVDAVCMRFHGESKKICVIKCTDIDDILDEVDDTKSHIVFIDGLIDGGGRKQYGKHLDVLRSCNTWAKKDRTRRRLVVVCAMPSLMFDVAASFSTFSWTLEEYLSAIEYDEFFNSIKDRLASSTDLHLLEAALAQPFRIELVISKFYFAGGSARYMFHFPNTHVRECLIDSVAAVSDIIPYIKGWTGDPTNVLVHRLLSTYHKPRYDKWKKYPSIVSAWAASELAIKGGPNLTRTLAAALRSEYNHSMDSWMIEMWFFACISKGGVNLCDPLGNITESWPPCSVVDFDKISLFPDDGVWLRPTTWNHGGYDAVFVDKSKNLVRFVQEKIPDFRLSGISGQGLLKSYRGWEEGKEENNVRILGLGGWD